MKIVSDSVSLSFHWSLSTITSTVCLLQIGHRKQQYSFPCSYPWEEIILFFMHYYMKWKLMKYFPKDTFCHIINMTFTFELFLLTTTKLYFPRWWWFESNMAEYNTINEASLPWQVKCRSTHKDVWVLQWYIFRLYYFLPIWDDKPCLYIRALQPDHRKIVTCLREKF